jgi:hypothetical protein
VLVRALAPFMSRVTPRARQVSANCWRAAGLPRDVKLPILKALVEKADFGRWPVLTSSNASLWSGPMSHHHLANPTGSPLVVGLKNFYWHSDVNIYRLDEASSNFHVGKSVRFRMPVSPRSGLWSAFRRFFQTNSLGCRLADLVFQRAANSWARI